LPPVTAAREGALSDFDVANGSLDAIKLGPAVDRRYSLLKLAQ
jgi:hypothetical protein